MLRAPTYVLELSNFDRPKAEKSSLSLSSFLLFLPFLSTNCFSFLFFSSFPFFLFLFFLFFFSFSHLISLSFSPHFLLSLFTFSSFLEHTTHPIKGGISSPFPQPICVAINFSSFSSYFLIPLYDIITYMAQCEL